MEYTQMTLNDWMEMKRKLKQELLGVKQSFVRIGYALRKIEDARLYEQDGYKSIAEFAKAEYGLEPSTTSRFMSINREYSIDGYSEQLRPGYAELGRSQLEEMLKLPEADREMIQPETSREDIRGLKRFNREEPAAGVADDIRQLVEKFFRDNTDILRQVFQEDMTNIRKMVEIINPSGNRSYKKGLFFLMLYENRIAVKKFGSTPQEMTWEEFLKITQDIFGDLRDDPELFGGAEDVEENAGAGETDQPGSGETETDTGTGAGGEAERDAEPDDTGERDAEQEDDGEDGAEQEDDGEDGAGQEDDTGGEESSQGDSESPADGEDTEPTGAEEPGEEIAPAQKSPEILEQEGILNDENEDISTGEDADQDEEPEREAAAGAETEETEPGSEDVTSTEVIDKPYGTRKEYLDSLTAYGMAMELSKLATEMMSKKTDITRYTFWEGWLLEEVDDHGRSIEEV